MEQKQELKRAGLKITVPRLRILDVLESSPQRHMSAEEVYNVLRNAGEEVGLATVYRVLTQFEAAELVIRHNFDGDHSVFELNEGEHHDHLFCTRCGKVEEFVDDVIEQHQQAIAERYGYDMTDHSLNIYGICSGCRKC